MRKWLLSHKQNIALVMSMVLPVLMMLFVFVLQGIYPFGKISILMGDMKCQFVDYLGYMKQIMNGNDDLFYSFSKTFGGDMSGFASYYLSSPFYLILLLFPNTELPAGIVLIILLGVGLAGLCFFLLLREVYEFRYSFLIFSTGYSFMGFLVSYMNCINYSFCIAIFPLVILGLYRTVKNERKSLLYVISLAVCIFANYYIGYMVVIFTAMFFLYYLIARMSSIRELKSKLKVIWIVLYTTVLAFLLPAFSLCATVYSLKGQKSSGILFSTHVNFPPLDFFGNVFNSAFHGNISDGLPLIYCGVLTTVFLLFFFINKNIPRKEKILAAIMFVIMFLSFWVDAINVIWHGFAHPIGFPYRNSFLFTFLICYFGYYGFSRFAADYKMYWGNIVIAIFVLYSAYMFLTHNPNVGLRQIIVTLVVVFLVIICVSGVKMQREFLISAMVALFLIQFGELTYNCYTSVDSLFPEKYSKEEYASIDIDTYKDFIRETQAIVDHIEQEDDSFYRMDKMYRRFNNDPMMFGYNGLTHYSSCETDQVKSFMGKLGFCNKGNYALYSTGSTSFVNCLMGVKYVFSNIDGLDKDMIQTETIGDKFIFTNPQALGLGFGMKDSVLDINMDEKDPFLLQNDIARAFTDTRYEIYRQVNVADICLYNVTVDGNKYTKIDPDEEAYIEYDLEVDSRDFIYMYLDAPAIQSTRLTVNEMEKLTYFTPHDWGIRECGYFNEGTKVPVRVYLEQNEIEITQYYFYYENRDVLEKWYADASATLCTTDKVTSSHLEMEADVDSDASWFVMTIPYEKDWIVTIDGKHITPVKVMDTLMAFPVTPGVHSISLRYIPIGLIVGTPISFVALITTFCVFFFTKKTKNTSAKKLLKIRR